MWGMLIPVRGMRRPQVGELLEAFGRSNTAGLSSFYTGDCTLMYTLREDTALADLLSGSQQRIWSRPNICLFQS